MAISNARIAKTARNRALNTCNTVQHVSPTPCAAGYMLTMYTTTRWPGLSTGGRGVVVARVVNPQGMVVAYRVRHNGITYTMPAGNLGAIGSLFVPKTIAHKVGYKG